MAKRNKVNKPTRAYKIGFTDGSNDLHKNPYHKGSVQHADYERGNKEAGKVEHERV